MASLTDYQDKIADFDASFAAHPASGDLIIKRNIAAINQHLKLLLIPGKYASLFRPNKTAGLSELLFEVESPAIQQTLRDRVKIAIAENRPNIVVNDVAVSLEENHVGIDIEYTIKDTNTVATYSTRLKRVR